MAFRNSLGFPFIPDVAQVGSQTPSPARHHMAAAAGEPFQRRAVRPADASPVTGFQPLCLREETR